mmetsp:Transcript_16865/g.18813  ORF Transcript_16865/g.18813 Transcript_16865/m.18813 type:complete len:345 (-) Transcript_16865:62-1096(-)
MQQQSACLEVLLVLVPAHVHAELVALGSRARENDDSNHEQAAEEGDADGNANHASGADVDVVVVVSVVVVDVGLVGNSALGLANKRGDGGGEDDVGLCVPGELGGAVDAVEEVSDADASRLLPQALVDGAVVVENHVGLGESAGATLSELCLRNVLLALLEGLLDLGNGEAIRVHVLLHSERRGGTHNSVVSGTTAEANGGRRLLGRLDVDPAEHVGVAAEALLKAALALKNSLGSEVLRDDSPLVPEHALPLASVLESSPGREDAGGGALHVHVHAANGAVEDEAAARLLERRGRGHEEQHGNCEVYLHLCLLWCEETSLTKRTGITTSAEKEGPSSSEVGAK